MDDYKTICSLDGYELDTSVIVIHFETDVIRATISIPDLSNLVEVVERISGEFVVEVEKNGTPIEVFRTSEWMMNYFEGAKKGSVSITANISNPVYGTPGSVEIAEAIDFGYDGEKYYIIVPDVIDGLIPGATINYNVATFEAVTIDLSLPAKKSPETRINV